MQICDEVTRRMVIKTAIKSASQQCFIVEETNLILEELSYG